MKEYTLGYFCQDYSFFFYFLHWHSYLSHPIHRGGPPGVIIVAQYDEMLFLLMYSIIALSISDLSALGETVTRYILFCFILISTHTDGSFFSVNFVMELLYLEEIQRLMSSTKKIITPTQMLDDSKDQMPPKKRKDKKQLPPIVYPPEIDHLLK